MSNAEERRRQKQAYLASLESQRQRRQSAPTASQPAAAELPTAHGGGVQGNRSHAEPKQAQRQRPLSERERAFEEKRQQYFSRLGDHAGNDSSNQAYQAPEPQAFVAPGAAPSFKTPEPDLIKPKEVFNAQEGFNLFADVLSTSQILAGTPDDPIDTYISQGIERNKHTNVEQEMKASNLFQDAFFNNGNDGASDQMKRQQKQQEQAEYARDLQKQIDHNERQKREKSISDDAYNQEKGRRQDDEDMRRKQEKVEYARALQSQINHNEQRKHEEKAREQRRRQQHAQQVDDYEEQMAALKKREKNEYAKALQQQIALKGGQKQHRAEAEVRQGHGHGRMNADADRGAVHASLDNDEQKEKMEKRERQQKYASDLRQQQVYRRQQEETPDQLFQQFRNNQPMRGPSEHENYGQHNKARGHQDNVIAHDANYDDFLSREKAEKLARQKEYAAALDAQQHNRQGDQRGGAGRGRGGAGWEGGEASVANIGADPDEASALRAQKRAKQAEYLQYLQGQEKIAQAKKKREKDLRREPAYPSVRGAHMQGDYEGGPGPADALNAHDNIHARNGAEYVMGPLGNPVRKVEEVGNRRLQKMLHQPMANQYAAQPHAQPPGAFGEQGFHAIGHDIPPVPANAPTGQLNYHNPPMPLQANDDNMSGVGSDGSEYLNEQQLRRMYPPQSMQHMPLQPSPQPWGAPPSVHEPPGADMQSPASLGPHAHAGLPGVAGAGGGYVSPRRGRGGGAASIGAGLGPSLAGEAEEDRKARIKVMQSEQARILEDQMQVVKARKAADKKRLEEEERKEFERLERERIDLSAKYEKEQQAAKAKAEADNKRILEQQIEAKKRQKEEELEKERAAEERERLRLEREQAEVQQKEARERERERAISGADANKQGYRELNSAEQESPMVAFGLDKPKEAFKIQNVFDPLTKDPPVESLSTDADLNDAEGAGRLKKGLFDPPSPVSHRGAKAKQFFRSDDAPDSGRQGAADYADSGTARKSSRRGTRRRPRDEEFAAHRTSSGDIVMHSEGVYQAGESDGDIEVMDEKDYMIQQAQREAAEAKKEVARLRKALADGEGVRLGGGGGDDKPDESNAGDEAMELRVVPPKAPPVRYRSRLGAATPSDPSISEQSPLNSSKSADRKPKKTKSLHRKKPLSPAEIVMSGSLARTLRSESRFVYPDGTTFVMKPSSRQRRQSIATRSTPRSGDLDDDALQAAVSKSAVDKDDTQSVESVFGFANVEQSVSSVSNGSLGSQRQTETGTVTGTVSSARGVETLAPAHSEAATRHDAASVAAVDKILGIDTVTADTDEIDVDELLSRNRRRLKALRQQDAPGGYLGAGMGGMGGAGDELDHLIGSAPSTSRSAFDGEKRGAGRRIERQASEHAANVAGNNDYNDNEEEGDERGALAKERERRYGRRERRPSALALAGMRALESQPSFTSSSRPTSRSSRPRSGPVTISSTINFEEFGL